MTEPQNFSASALQFDTITRVDEIVTDVLAMDLLHSSPAFLRKVLALAGEGPDSRIVGIRRSVFDTSMGETDIELVVDGNQGRCGILIENKIRAPLMDRQFARYRMRGADRVNKGAWSRFCVILMSPRSYCEALDVQHSQNIDANLAYEAIVDFLADHPEHAFKRHVFLSAIADYRKGYTQLPDPPMMEFYRAYWALASSEFPQLRMERPSVVGKDCSWIYFPPLYGPGAKVRLIHKFKGIGCELAVTTRRAEEIAETLAPLLQEDMIIRTAKSAAYINVKAPTLNHLLPFETIRDDVSAGLRALDRLRIFAMSKEVRERVMVVI